MTKLRQLILQNRSYRRFDNAFKLSDDDLLQLVELTRFVPSARNAQALKYILASDEEKCNTIFPNLGWAGYLKDWDGPSPEEQPSAYIVILKDKTIGEQIFCDDGIAIQTILLGAVNKGFGGCIFGTVNRKKLAGYFKLPETLEILYVIALGKPKETVILEDIQDNDVKYWREKDGTHHVPKRSLNSLIYK